MYEMIQEITIESNINNVYDALVEEEQLTQWWTHSVKTKPVIGSTSEFGFYGGQVVFKMTVIDLKKPKSVQWECVGGPPEWVDTKLSFTLKEHENRTVLRFKHLNWKSTENSFGMVNHSWALYLKSLKDFIETCTGAPNTT